METMTTTITHISNGTEEDLKIFDSMLNSAQIDINAQHANQTMFTTPNTRYANEGFRAMNPGSNYKIKVLIMIAIVLVILLYSFHTK